MNKKASQKSEIPFRDGVYEGEIRDGFPHGVGTYTCKEFVYIGTWFYGTMSGLGVMRYADGGLYKGEFYADRRHGQGQEDVITADGKIQYIGGWKDGQKHGRGIEVSFQEGIEIRHEGIWQHGEKT